MPRETRYLNAFSKSEVHKITGLSLHMIDYLERNGYLRATYRDPRSAEGGERQGRVRYYSYRDLVVARIIQRLRETGVRLNRIKSAMQYLRSDEAWGFAKRQDSAIGPVKWLVSDGRQPKLKAEDGFLDELKVGGQRSFAFIVGIEGTQAELMKHPALEGRRQEFTMENRPLIPDKRVG
jgi:DNA-binding transcriptional MerR regulator